MVLRTMLVTAAAVLMLVSVASPARSDAEKKDARSQTAAGQSQDKTKVKKTSTKGAESAKAKSASPFSSRRKSGAPCEEVGPCGKCDC